MRILGLDYGSKTVGVALSDATCLIAQPLETIERKQENKLRQTYARIEALVVEHDVDKIVLGLPKMMNNTEGPRVQATREFAENLERRTGLPIIFEDEIPKTLANNVSNLGNIVNIRTPKHTKSHSNAYLKSMLFFLT